MDHDHHRHRRCLQDDARPGNDHHHLPGRSRQLRQTGGAAAGKRAVQVRVHGYILLCDGRERNEIKR